MENIIIVSKANVLVVLVKEDCTSLMRYHFTLWRKRRCKKQNELSCRVVSCGTNDKHVGNALNLERGKVCESGRRISKFISFSVSISSQINLLPAGLLRNINKSKLMLGELRVRTCFGQAALTLYSVFEGEFSSINC